MTFGARARAPAAAARQPPGADRRCAARWRRAWPPTATTTRTRSPTRSGASAAIAGQPGLVVVVSDFRGQDGWTNALGSLRTRHSVLAVEVRDPREGTLPAVGHLALVDPETGERVEVDTSRRGLRERFAAAARAEREALAGELRRLRVDHAVLSTDDDWLLELGRTLR